MYVLGLPRWLSDKESACSARDLGLIPGLGRSPGEGNGSPLQYSCLGNPMHRGAWRATVQRLGHDWVTEHSHMCVLYFVIFIAEIQLFSSSHLANSFPSIVTMFKEKVKVKGAQSCPALWNPMDYTVCGILQARILEWVAIPFSRGSSQPREQTQVSNIEGGFFTSWATREAHLMKGPFITVWQRQEKSKRDGEGVLRKQQWKLMLLLSLKGKRYPVIGNQQELEMWEADGSTGTGM